MSLVKSFTICFVALLVYICVYRACDSLDRLTVALHEECLIGDGTPPKYLNDPDREPFSYRKKVEKSRAR